MGVDSRDLLDADAPDAAPSTRESQKVFGGWGGTGALLVVWLVGAAIFFRPQWRSGFRTVVGNDGDMRLAVYLCEHWFRVFHGQDSWLNPQFFYPVKGLLGWSDTFALYQVFYTPLRLLGCDPFLALQLTIILLSLVGFLSFVALVREGFGTSLPLAAALGLVFAFSNALWLHAGAAQDSGLYLIPLVIWVGLRAWRSAVSPRRRLAPLVGLGLGLLVALVPYSTYYVSYFSVLCAVIALIVLVATGARSAWEWIRAELPARWPTIGGAAAGLVVGLVPFALTYLPSRPDDPGTSYAEAMVYAARWKDVLDIGKGNLLWSPPRQGMYELTYAVTPILMLATVVLGAICARRVFTRTAEHAHLARLAATLALTAVVAELLPVHTRFATPWAVIYHLPGANALRGIDRIDLVAGLLATMALAAALGELWGSRPGRRTRWVRAALAVVIALTLVEQINTSPTSAVNRRVQAALLASVLPAPVDCRSFYVVDSRGSLPFFESQLDAMLISQKLHLPTLNGYTAKNPISWNLAVIGSPAYLGAVRSWVAVKNVPPGLCQLDLGTMKWAPASLS